MLSVRAINTICATIAVTLEKGANFSFTIGENFSQFLNWIFCIVLGTEFNEFLVFSAVIVVICTGFILYINATVIFLCGCQDIYFYTLIEPHIKLQTFCENLFTVCGKSDFLEVSPTIMLDL